MVLNKTSLLDLPEDVILLILPYLDVRAFINLTATCRHLNSYSDEHTFWAAATRATFRVPNQPVVAKDGRRWQSLYKRLRTQTKAYGWGENSSNCLGFVLEERGYTGPDIMRQQRQRNICWPEEMTRLNDIGIISDLQCGGWSTSALTSTGVLHVCGVIDGQAGQRSSDHALRLAYPGPTQSEDKHEAKTAIKQYSHGRAHILALSDAGIIWSWRNTAHTAIKIKFIHHDTIENASRGRGTVKKVVAGWNKSAALVEGSGIVVWEPIGRPHDGSNVMDTALILDSAVVPMSNPTREEASTIGNVANFIVLEDCIVFNTETGKIFVSRFTLTQGSLTMGEAIELALPVTSDRVTDVQGTFRNAAVFTESGAVLTTNTSRLLSNHIPEENRFTKIAALQDTQVIALAFGDYHFHALHAPGHITSYGKEPQSCGALGLGGYATPEGRIRGIRHERPNFPGSHHSRGDGLLVPHAYHTGRRVWFEPTKREWIKYITSGGVDAHEAVDRMRLSIGSNDIAAQGEVSEWIEQEGRDWEDKFHVRSEGDDNLPAYFALSVTAAGWHSAALVLVNEELAARVDAAVEVPDYEMLPSVTPIGSITSIASSLYGLGRWLLSFYIGSTYDNPEAILQRHSKDWGASPRPGYHYAWAYDFFPRLRLSNGEEMPGSAPFNEWRYGEPQWRYDDPLWWLIT